MENHDLKTGECCTMSTGWECVCDNPWWRKANAPPTAPAGGPSERENEQHEVERLAAELVGVLGAGWSWPSIVDRYPEGHPAREHWLKAARTLHARGVRAASPGAAREEARDGD